MGNAPIPMALKEPRFVDGVPGSSVAGEPEGGLDRVLVVQEPDDVGVAREWVREGSQRDVPGRTVSDLAGPPEAITRLVPDVCPGGDHGGAQIAKPKVTGDQGARSWGRGAFGLEVVKARGGRRRCASADRDG